MSNRATESPGTFEQLVYANVNHRIDGSGRGYGVAAHSTGWPSRSLGSSHGGLHSIIKYNASPTTPNSVVMHEVPSGRVVALRSAGSRDGDGRSSYTVHALLDPSHAVHPREALALVHSGRLIAEWKSSETNAELGAVTAQAPRPPMVSRSQTLEAMVAHLLRQYVEKIQTCVFLVASSELALDLIEQAVWCVPARMSADVRFSTWEPNPTASGNPVGSKLPAFTFAAVSDTRAIDDRVDDANVWNIDRVTAPRRDDMYAAMAADLVAFASRGEYPPDLEGVKSLENWLHPAPHPDPEQLQDRPVDAQLVIAREADSAARPTTVNPDRIDHEGQTTARTHRNSLTDKEKRRLLECLTDDVMDTSTGRDIVSLWWIKPADAARTMNGMLAGMNSAQQRRAEERIAELSALSLVPALDIARRVTTTDSCNIVNLIVDAAVDRARRYVTDHTQPELDPIPTTSNPRKWISWLSFWGKSRD